MHKIRISCSDSFELAGTFFPAQHPKGAVLIGPATGIRQRFYQSFAQYLSQHQYAVLTFENRGIGESKGAYSPGNEPTLINWGRLDMTAALEVLKIKVPHSRYHIVGHSAGGQLIGLMENAMDIASLFNFAASSGSLRNMSYPFKAMAAFFLNVYIPVNNLLLGKTHSEWVGMGETLPKKVAKQWSKWCNGSGYVATELDQLEHHLYNDLRFPSFWMHATDDGIANLANVQDMIRVFPQIQSEIKTLDPQALGYKEIGHMSFFSSRKKELWQHAVDWLEAH